MSEEKKIQALKTLKWLEENYCSTSDVCLPREMVYDHYLDFCLKNNIGPTSKATFGKIIRSKFPEVTSKRLGTRGHSKYHYHGIAMKKNNLSLAISHIHGWTRFSGSRSKNEKFKKSEASDDLTLSFSLSSKLGTLIPKFPEACELNLGEEIDGSLLQVFLTMYKIHCQCIVDAVISGNFEQIEIFLLHFWHEMPDHLLPIINVSFVEDIIVNCDWILYKTLLNILFPTSVQKFPDALLNSIYTLGYYWIKWLKDSLENFKPSLLDKKIKIGKLFAKFLRRHVSVLHAAQILTPCLSAEIVNPLLSDDFYEINNWVINTIFYATHTEEKNEISWCINVIKDLQVQLQNSPTIEGLIETIESVMNKELVKDSLQSTNDILDIARSLVLKCNYLFSRLCQWLTLKTSDNFVLFHLLLTFLHEYQLLIVETLQEQKQEEEIHMQTQICLKTKHVMEHPLSSICIPAELVNDKDQHESCCQRHSKRRQKEPQKFKRKKIVSESLKQNKPKHVELDTSQHLLHIKAMNDNLHSSINMADPKDDKQHQNTDFSCYENGKLLENVKLFCSNSQECRIPNYNDQNLQMGQEWHSCAFQSSKHAFNEIDLNSSATNWNQYNHLDGWFPTPDQMANETNNYYSSGKDFQQSNPPYTAAQGLFEEITLQHEQSHTFSECYFREHNSVFDVMKCFVS